VLLFETDGGWKQFCGVELPTLENHKYGFNVLYSDYHVSFENLKEVLYLTWGDEQKE